MQLADGSSILAGAFQTINSVRRPLVARLLADGTFDPTFAATLVTAGQSIESAYSAALQADGKILVGGVFTISGRQNILRLNANGSLDTTFDPGTAVAGGGFGVAAIAVQADGHILAGGDFTATTGAGGNHLLRLNPNGTIDTTFNSGTAAAGGVFNYGVQSLVITSAGKILAGGGFTKATGAASDYIVQLTSTGAVDTGFATVAVTTATNQGIRAILVQPNGHILMGGDFATVNGSPRSAIAR